MFVGCSEEESESPTVPVEIDVSSCGTCYNVSTDNIAKKIQLKASVHATGENFERNSNTCAPCHTSEGFREVLATGSNVTENIIKDPTPPNMRWLQYLPFN